MKNRREGFTLLEMLVSLGIVSSMVILIAQVFFSTTRTNTKTELLKDTKQNGLYSIDSIERMIRSALRVEAICDIAPGTTMQSLDIKNPDYTTTTLGCTPDSFNGVTRISSVNTTEGAQYLTSGNLTLGGTSSCADATLQFVCVAHPDGPPSITVSFSLSQKGTPPDQFEKASVSFQTTVTPRNN